MDFSDNMAGCKELQIGTWVAVAFAETCVAVSSQLLLSVLSRLEPLWVCNHTSDWIVQIYPKGASTHAPYCKFD